MVLIQEHLVIRCLSQVFFDLRRVIFMIARFVYRLWLYDIPDLCYFIIILYQFLPYIIILQDKVMVSLFQHSKPNVGKHASLTKVLTFGIKC